MIMRWFTEVGNRCFYCKRSLHAACVQQREDDTPSAEASYMCESGKCRDYRLAYCSGVLLLPQSKKSGAADEVLASDRVTDENTAQAQPEPQVTC